jgi:Carboxypeptidase regulatory-like domain/TonB dependent receptor/TonB-dependent Receptor Plug Domain
MHHRTFRYVLIGAIAYIATAIALLAQTITGSVTGTVTDQSGAVIPNATVIAKNVATGVETRSTTNGAGDYNIRFLQIGQYTITVQNSGFDDQKVGPITLEVDQIARVNVRLAISGSTQQVTVSSDLQPILDTDNSRVATTFTASTIENIPLNGRNFSALTQFQPGSVNTQPQGMSGVNAIERDTDQGGQVSVNGNRAQSNNYRLDGIEINETINNTIGYNPAPEAIGNMTVITSNADAEFGNVNGGDVNAVLKSGTNHLHGGAYGYLQDDKLSANTWANNFAGTPKQPYTQSIFGGTLGGPIKPNKLFFFIDYEGVRYHQGGLQAASVIPEAMRNGDFSALLTQGSPIQLYHFVPGQGQVQYVNNQVPVNNPAAIFLRNHPELYPLPNRVASPGTYGVLNNYQGPYRKIVFNDQGDVKVDYTVGEHDTIMGRYSQSDAGDQQTLAPLLITFPTASQFPYKGVAVNWIHTFSPSIVNEARAGFSRVRWVQGVPTDPTGAFGLNGNNLLGINAPQPYPGFTNLAFNAQASGSSNSADVPTNLGNSAVAGNLIDNTFTYGDDLTILRGKHTFKMGVEILRYQQNDFYPGNTGAMGTLGYSGSFTQGPSNAPGYSVADFVADQGYVAGVGQVTGRTGQRQYRDAAFFQDDWKVLPNFTVNLGLRYEYDQPIYEVNEKQANVDLATGAFYVAGQAGADKVFGDSHALYHPVYSNFMPRVGFSWQARPRVVVRGGYGITNYLEGTGAALRLNFNPPFHDSFSETALTPTATSPGTPITSAAGIPVGATAPVTSLNAWDSHLKPAFIQEFSLGVEYQLNNETSVSATYLGQLGDHLINPRAANQLSAPGAAAPYANLVGQQGAVVETESAAVMRYNALQVQVRRRQNNGVEYQVNYTYAHSLTNSAGFFGVNDVNGASPYWQDANNGKADYGNAGFDVRHSLSATGVYQLPFGRGKKFGSNAGNLLNQAIGGWKLSGDAIVFSGLPVTINGPNNTNVFNRAERANHYRRMIIKDRSVAHWFGTDPSAVPCQGLGVDNGQCAYGAAAVGAFGTAGNNTERAPGYEQIDLAASKSFAITEAQHLEYRVDFFNAFNIASYDNPDNNVQDGTFGKITNVRSLPRQIQMSLHYTF